MASFWFVLPLVAGLVLVAASAFTTSFSRRWGARRGTTVSAALRTYAGMPLVLAGIALTFLDPGPFVLPWASLPLGAALMAVGLAGYVWGHVQLGKPTGWPSMEDRLVDHGIFGVVRHPIYSSSVLIALGLLIAFPNQTVAVCVAIVFPSLIGQAFLEEIDLKQRLPRYVDYMQRVPRFVPRLRRGAP